ncbi:MAG TPA: hypothetical protein DCQ64_26570 [Candidatus Rokubacteria bacterium]|nr:hypothetical protein [Candidatus Rokubacteria bacterium]
MATTAETVELQVIEQDERVQELSQGSIELLQRAQSITITDDESDLEAAEFLAQVKTARKRIEELRHWFTDPLEAQKKAIIARFKATDAPLDRAEKIVGGKHIAYTQAKEEANNREQERLRKLAEAKQARQAARAEEKGLEAPPVVIPMPTIAAPQKTIHTSAGSVTVRKVWRHQVVDFAALPEEYKIADDVKLGKVVRAGVREIPGVRIYEEMVV